MVKRCSAQNCYNSQLTHKIAYFGYPKNEIVARQWARLAGRNDLAEKKLDNLTKYYLCSDHFSNDSFANPDSEDKSFLRLNRTLSIPIPNIFENNLMKNVKSVTENPEKFLNYTKHITADHMSKQDFSSSNRLSDEHPKNLKIENLNEENEDEVTVEYIDEELLESCKHENSIDISALCRLCACSVEDLIPIFNEKGKLHVETECLRLMPAGMIGCDDGLPQYACMECLEKLQSCSNIIEGFVMNQTLFESE